LLAAMSVPSILGGCAGQKGADAEPELQRAEVTIEVENQNFSDARIYLLLYGERTRLGLVPGHSTRTFSFALPPDDVRIEVRFIGGGGFVTEPMPVSPDDQLVLQIRPDANQQPLEGGRGTDAPTSSNRLYGERTRTSRATGDALIPGAHPEGVAA
jgi:hypothetical protein